MTKKKMINNPHGRPSYKPNAKDRGRIIAMAEKGVPQTHIAARIGVCKDTIRKYYLEELTAGTGKAVADIAETLYDKAKDGDNTCMMFYLKTRAGYKETIKNEHTGADGGAIDQNWTVEFVNASPEIK